jgi:16S rRNA (uracil1498-N3)-methyltransferase
MTRSPHIVLSETLQGCGAGVAIALDDAQRHHLRTVLRLAVGAGVSVTDGDGRTAEGELGETAIRLTAAPRRTPPRSPRLVLAQAVTKGRRLDDTVRAVCELGVDVIVPFVAARTQGRPDGKEAEALRARWRAIAVAALSQSRGAWVTSVGALVEDNFATGAGSARRRTASKAMAPQAKISSRALPRAASTVALP